MCLQNKNITYPINNKNHYDSLHAERQMLNDKTQHELSVDAAL